MSFAALRGIGTAVPETVIDRQEAEQLARAFVTPTEEQATWLHSIIEGTDIRTRHFCFSREALHDIHNGTDYTGSIFLPKGTAEDPGPTTGQRMEHYEDHATPLALRAARSAMEQAKLPVTGFTHLVTVSCTGFHAPGVDIQIIKHLNLPRTIERTHVGFMGCHGAMNGLRVTHALTRAWPNACVLLCAVELCGAHYHYRWDPQKIVANCLFGDGAGAAVLTSTTQSHEDMWQLAASGSCIVPNTTKLMTWTVGDNGFEMTLSRKVPKVIEQHLRPWLNKWLSKHDLTLADIGSWAVHPGGPNILDGFENALGLDKDATIHSREILSRYGNMSSPTILFVLERMLEERVARPCVALGFGPGLTVEAALLR